MKIAVIGTGYVGLVTGVTLSEIGHQVTCVDVDKEKVNTLNKGVSPIYEEGLTELLEKNLERGTLTFTADYDEGMLGKDIIYLTVGTPQGKDGSADLTYIDKACDSIAASLQQNAIIVTKSTVPVGTNSYIKSRFEEKLSSNIKVKIVSNPEFLRQGSAVYDTFNGDRIVIGSDNTEALETIAEVNAPFNLPIVKTDLRSAEMIKYAANAFLATKISFINEIANLSEQVGANVDLVADGIGMDKRIGRAFLNAGAGFGGSCFPKDTNALISIGKEVDYTMPLLESVIKVNDKQRSIIADKVIANYADLSGKKIAVLGLAFKPNTDDMRDAPSIQITERLIEQGANLYAYDPVAIENAKKVLSGQVEYCSNIESALQNADMAIILTEWQEIKDFPLSAYKQYMKKPVLFDGRNCFTIEQINGSGIEYHSIGRPVEKAN
ncbi:UDP-glucose dehydrogenase family protein [Oceanobacillus manasiensis]|uniref:UDP-glucose dehydrogenase family protein n=1 Tax=Oceanobacillus manasiensis TaxID=586413 RepID=UPI0005A97698|nr:UDP-glucose/GDP-mannose dehydrogenase family protein [Oceanobacillus manasiensis]